MSVLDVLDADAVRRWSRTAVELLDGERGTIDALNVFPVADGDTGTNMWTTLRAADRALVDAPASVGWDDTAGAALQAMAAGAAAGAIGNSGFILSQLLRGLAEAARAAGVWDAAALRAGLDDGAELGRRAVVRPVEGTMLTVAEAAARAAAGASPDRAGDTLAEVVAAAVAAADSALQRTPDQLRELADAGVVDAGGRGLLVVLDALARTVTGVPSRTAASSHALAVTAPQPSAPSPVPRAFEVQYRLAADERALSDLRSTLASLGDSVAVVGLGDAVGTGAADGGADWKVHVHVPGTAIGAAIEAGLTAGRPRGIEVVELDAPPAPESYAAHHRGPGGVVALAPGSGLAPLFRAEGVVVVEGAGPVTGPVADPAAGESTGRAVARVVAALRAAPARNLVLLPNDPDHREVAAAAARTVRADGVRVVVVPTRSPVQGLAAIAVHDAERPFDDDVVAMAEAAAATRFAEVTFADAEALTAVGICQPGDVLGLIDGEVVEIGRGVLAMAFGLADRLLAIGAELLTVLVGDGAPVRAGELIEAHIRGRAPLTDVARFAGGQPGRAVIIGAE